MQKSVYLDELLNLRKVSEPLEIAYNEDHMVKISNQALLLFAKIPTVKQSIFTGTPSLIMEKDNQFIYYRTLLCSVINKPEITLRFPLKYQTAAKQIMEDYLLYIMGDQDDKLVPRAVNAARFGIIYESFEVVKDLYSAMWPSVLIEKNPDFRALAIDFVDQVSDQMIHNCHSCQQLITNKLVDCETCPYIKYCSLACKQADKEHRKE